MDKSARMILASLIQCPDECATLIPRIRGLHYEYPILGELIHGACNEFDKHGVVAVDPLVDTVTNETEFSRRQCEEALIESMEFIVFVVDTRSIERAVAYEEERFANAAQERSIKRIAKELTGVSPDLNKIACKLDELMTSVDPTTRGLETLASSLKSDPSEEPLDILRTGLGWFDDALPHGGFQRGDKVVFSAPPGAGKTALALQLALKILSTNTDAKVVWCLGEMTERALRNRALQCASGLKVSTLRKQWDDLSPIEMLDKKKAIDLLSNIGRRFYFLPAPLTPRTIEDAVVSIKADFVAIDYLQLVRPETNKPNRRDEVDEVVREFMRISQRHSPVLFLISDQGKGAEFGRDIYSAFKESSEIAFAADLAYVAEVMDRPGDDGELPEPVSIKMRCLKARHGKAKDMVLQFSRDGQSFAGAQETFVP